MTSELFHSIATLNTYTYMYRYIGFPCSDMVFKGTWCENHVSSIIVPGYVAF